LESWKILNHVEPPAPAAAAPAGAAGAVGATPPATPTNDQPTYQTLDLTNVNGLLKLMSRYYKQPGNTPPTINDVFNGNSTTSYSNYKDSYQQTDLNKAVLWSIIRNTPPFWGNLFYDRIVVGSTPTSTTPTLTNLYHHNSNFNKITNISPPPYNLEFNYELNENTLFKPFCENTNVKDNQKILWDNILKYIGGNKRKIQLARNVRNVDYNDYIESKIETSLRNILYNDNTSNSNFYMGIDRTTLINHINKLLPIIKLSKRDYIINSLLDLARITGE